MVFKADLHTHTHFSDGYLSVESLLKKASSRNIKILSITDHDTLEGYAQAVTLSSQYNVLVIPGIELSTQYEGYEVHVLGYYFDYKNKVLSGYIRHFSEKRISRAEAIIENLKALGIEITIEDVLNEAKFGNIGRPHIARALVRKKIVKNFGEAFRNYLGNNNPVNEPKFTLSPEEGIGLIKDAGGVAFLAHPGDFPEEFLEVLFARGFDGIEAIHPSHTSPVTSRLIRFAKEKGVPFSGGSDFHASNERDESNFGKYFLNEDMFRSFNSIRAHPAISES
ncbi:MAG: PHP domain-containing protein [Ignavibacteriaceae bacterium]|nr:PHP domain-containing protein [Ignavibacteriaceae bacterium]